MKTSDISISRDRVAVEFNNQIIQFVCWDLKKEQFNELKTQLKTAFTLSSNFTDIEIHMKLNGFECELEDIN